MGEEKRELDAGLGVASSGTTSDLILESVENLEIHKVFLRFPNLNLEHNSSLTALAIESEVP